MNNKSSYDDIFNTYSSDGNNDNNKKNNNTSNNNDNKKLEKEIKRKFKTNHKSNRISKIILIVLIIGVLVGGGLYIYNSREEIIDLIEEPTVEVELKDTELSMIVGDTHKLDYEITSGVTSSEEISLLKFSSSDPTIVKVDKEGNLKAIGAGDAIITITYNGKDGEESKTCKVNVINVAVDDEIVQEAQKRLEELTENYQQKKQDEIDKYRKIIEEGQKKAQEAAQREAAQREAEGKKRAGITN